jgi:hypothetical protein
MCTCVSHLHGWRINSCLPVGERRELPLASFKDSARRQTSVRVRLSCMSMCSSCMHGISVCVCMHLNIVGCVAHAIFALYLHFLEQRDT